MKIKKLILPALIIMLVFAACKDKKSEAKEEIKSEQVAADTYQCPMDCEDRKTYDKPGTCPVCKMDLALNEKKGKSSCKGMQCCKREHDGKECSKEDCKMQCEKMNCSKDKEGKCTGECKEKAGTACSENKGGKCTEACKGHSEKMECTKDKDGNCTGKCSGKCKEKAGKTTCSEHKDAKCTEACKEHAEKSKDTI